ncbi:MAG: hypothetical protein ACRDA5_10540 [Clostridium sp.]
MLKINSYVNTCEDNNSDEPIESTVIVESNHSDIGVDTTIIKDDDDNIYVSTVVEDHVTCTEVCINTVVINTNNIVNCSQIFATNNSNYKVRWALVSLTGEILYTTKETFDGGSICIIMLDSIKINQLSRFKLKALVPDKDDTSSVILKYCPKSSEAANFIFKGTCFKTNIYYIGTSII